MKRDLLKGIVLISAVALSSCSTLTDISSNKIIGDDVYYTKAKAGVSEYSVPEYVEQPQLRNDDYYYYGDYESRIRRFSYASPFDYDDDYYGDYVPYTSVSYRDTTEQYAYAPDDYTYDPYYDELGVYSAYDFGYGDYWGYDNFGYGIAYSTFVYSGGTRATHRKDYSHSNNNDGIFVRANTGNHHYGNSIFSQGINGSGAAKATVPAFTRGNTAAVGNPGFKGMRPGGSNAVYPGRPGMNSTTGQSINSVAGTNRPIRPADENPRAVRPAIERATLPSLPPSTSSSSRGSSSSSNSSGSSSGGGGSSSGGGGRPVRP
ncbi:hypothetical protein [Mucilaginibacter panaciglaebae]|uniref:Uncharacterized protein n=1 Tax=Mucilaginibacter panaciglaebae TaxID=502331 RepID=A0ABP7X4L8_9SPHI